MPVHKYLTAEREACRSLLSKEKKKSRTKTKHAGAVNVWHIRKYQHRRADNSALRLTVFVKRHLLLREDFIRLGNVDSWQKVRDVVPLSLTPSHIGRFPKQILNVGTAHDLS